MLDLLARARQFADPHRHRHTLTRRRRLVAAVLAGLGVLFMIASLRPSGSPPAIDSPVSATLNGHEVAVPVLVRPAAIATALEPGMVVDVVDPNQPSAPLVERARVTRLPGGGFGPTSEAIVVLAVPSDDGMLLASAATGGITVIIRSTS